jgi:hypothetical protein
MDNFSVYELISFAKTFSRFFYLDRTVSVTKEEQKAAIEVLKKLADNRNGWTQEQKDRYRTFANFAKEFAEDIDAK